MAKTTRIKLLNVPEHLEPGDAIECVVDDVPYKCEFVKQGSHRRIIIARIYGLCERARGRLSTQVSMFEPPSFVEHFVVNDAPGRSWHRTATMAVEVG